jgi:hypothetical protein
MRSSVQSALTCTVACRIENVLTRKLYSVIEFVVNECMIGSVDKCIHEST